MNLTADYEKVRQETPAPVLDVGVSGNFAKTVECRGIIDTGASITMIAPSVVGALDLKVEGAIPLGGITGARVFPTYTINLSIGGTVFEGIRAAGFEEEARMLIGRNVINLWDLHLSGRTRTLALEPWSTKGTDAW